MFKQLNAPLGKFGDAILKISTQGVIGGPAARVQADARIKDLVAKRDVLIAEMRPAFDDSKQLSHAQVFDLLKRAQALMEQAAQ